jgi:hypothetical protein
MLDFYNNYMNKEYDIDGTYKLNWQGLPLALVGTIDLAKQFHHIAFILKKRETGKETRIKIKEVHEFIIYVCYLYIIFYNVFN